MTKDAAMQREIRPKGPPGRSFLLTLSLGSIFLLMTRDSTTTLSSNRGSHLQRRQLEDSPFPSVEVGLEDGLEIESTLQDGLEIESTVSSDKVNASDVPVPIYTFHLEGVSDESPEEERALLDAWSSAWAAKGWIPRVLTLDDARRHPHYVQYHGAEVMEHGRDRYSKLCYLRWLAMAEVGGGLMTDYDTVPLDGPRAEDVNPGRFATFCATRAQVEDDEAERQRVGRSGADGTFHRRDGHLLRRYQSQSGVPCLMSGSADEWLRMFLRLEYTSAKTEEMPTDVWTEMRGVNYLGHLSQFDRRQEQRVVGWGNGLTHCTFRTV